ncbi:MAG: DUF2306 domain-containing protein [Acidobacteria bacterium]|nr:MAG: DUF2306 domain-containing protein [Acidobacteriota bacterium]REK03592.1 MAG: DUF2306 domain-containing protein [Acidobacteriota bacterium]
MLQQTLSSETQSDSATTRSLGSRRRWTLLLRRFGWALVAVLSLAMAVWSWRFLLVDADVLYPGATRPEAVPSELHFHGLLRESWLRFAAHFVFGPIALAVGPFQFLSWLRARRPRLHRVLGYVYAVSILIAGAASLLLAPTSFGGLVTHVGFGTLAVLWLVATGLAVLHARARRFDVHREWMLRSFALTFGAVTLRLWIGVFMASGHGFEATYQVVAWLSWVPNLVLVEWWIALRHDRRRGALAA